MIYDRETLSDQLAILSLLFVTDMVDYAAHVIHNEVASMVSVFVGDNLPTRSYPGLI
jgi:hypothetical protein